MIRVLKNRSFRKVLSSSFATLARLQGHDPSPNRVRILMYHRVDRLKDYDQIVVTPEAFEQQMDYLVAHGYETISLAQLLSARQTPSALPPQPIVITFDDGFQDVYRNAFPILHRRGFTATIFPVSQWVLYRPSPKHPNPILGRSSYLSWEEISEMVVHGFEVGAHTRTHLLLPTLSTEQAWEEIHQSKQEIEEKLRQPVHFFCYPNGSFNVEHKEMVQRAGFLGACSIRPGPNKPTTDPFALRRTEISPRDDIFDLHRKLCGGFDILHRIHHALTN